MKNSELKTTFMDLNRYLYFILYKHHLFYTHLYLPACSIRKSRNIKVPFDRIRAL